MANTTSGNVRWRLHDVLLIIYRPLFANLLDILRATLSFHCLCSVLLDSAHGPSFVQQCCPWNNTTGKNKRIAQPVNCGIELFENTFDFFLILPKRGPSTVSHNAGVMLPAPAVPALNDPPAKQLKRKHFPFSFLLFKSYWSLYSTWIINREIFCFFVFRVGKCLKKNYFDDYTHANQCKTVECGSWTLLSYPRSTG